MARSRMSIGCYEVDRPEVMTQAHRVIAVVKQHCAERTAQP
jgi:hypothetical protein